MVSQTKLIPTPATFFVWYKAVIALYAIDIKQLTQPQLAQRNKLFELLLADCLSPAPNLHGLSLLKAIATLKMLDGQKFNIQAAAIQAAQPPSLVP